MKYLFLILLIAALLWIAYIFWANRRKSPYDSRDSGGGGDSGGSCSSSSCDDGGCGGGDGGGGGD